MKTLYKLLLYTLLFNQIIDLSSGEEILNTAAIISSSTDIQEETIVVVDEEETKTVSHSKQKYLRRQQTQQHETNSQNNNIQQNLKNENRLLQIFPTISENLSQRELVRRILIELKVYHNVPVRHRFAGSVCRWDGITCNSDRKVISIQINQADFTENDSPQLVAYLPRDISLLEELETLDLQYRNFMGTLPSELSKLKKMKYLTLKLPGVRGSIPSELGQLTELKNFTLTSHNTLTGSIPSTLSNLISLEHFDLHYNGDMMSTIPIGVTSLQNLHTFRVIHSGLYGRVPPQMFDSMPSLRVLDLSYNSISILRTIPASTKLEYIDLGLNDISKPSNKILQSISSSSSEEEVDDGFIPFENLIRFDMSVNDISGPLDPILQALLPPAPDQQQKQNNLYISPLEYLDLSANVNLNGTLSGTLFSSFTNLKSILIFLNSMTSTIPSELGLMKDLEVLTLSFNSFSGELPQELASLPKLRRLNVMRNEDLVGDASHLCHVESFNYKDTGVTAVCSEEEEQK